jgi:hypothetical protein
MLPSFFKDGDNGLINFICHKIADDEWRVSYYSGKTKKSCTFLRRPKLTPAPRCSSTLLRISSSAFLEELVNDATDRFLPLFRMSNPFFHHRGERIERDNKSPHFLVLPLVACFNLSGNV